MGRSKNLLRNYCAKDGLAYWKVTCAGGSGFKCEESAVGCKPIRECCRAVKGEMGCWATSHQLCEKYQLVCLLERGISDKKLDNKKPPITVRDWYSPRFDCGCNYRFSVRLLGADRETELDKWEFSATKEAGADWSKARHVFKKYPSGVRYVEFKHGGQDTKCWAGHYGVKMTNSGVFVGKNKKRLAKRDVKNMSGKNMLRNPCGKSALEGWEVTSSGGDGFRVEETAAGCKSIKDVNQEAQEGWCWATSHGHCEKQQVIDLNSQGFNGNFMDKNKPEIKFSEWVGVRGDAGCKYNLRVRLLSSSMQEIAIREFTEARDAGSDWFKISGSFTNYPDGVRFIEYKHGGSDNCCWAGYYGAKISCSSVTVIVAVEDPNLLQNPCGRSELEGWEVTSSGGDGFRVEETAAGCKSIKEVNQEAEESSCWATSNGLCEKQQVIDLGVKGFDGKMMDITKPEIKFSEWVGVRGDAGCNYNLSVKLLNNDKEELCSKEFKEKRDAGSDWFKVSGRFTDYPAGVRFIEYKHGGSDNCFWAGHYGAKISCSSVTVNLDPDSSSSSDDN